MNEQKAIIIFISIVILAVLIAVTGILFNIRKAAKLFRDSEKQDEEEADENSEIKIDN